MGLCNSPDIFQEKMSTLLGDLKFVHAYIDDLFITMMSTSEDHLECLEVVFQHLQDTGLKVNANKSFFAQQEGADMG